VKTLVATMAAIGEPLKDSEAVAYLLAGLDSDYEYLVTAMTTRSNLVGLNELYGYLLNYETRNEKKHKTVQFSASANHVVDLLVVLLEGEETLAVAEAEAMDVVEAATTTIGHPAKSSKEQTMMH
jgi:uncharacterized protein YaiE (UPF0345 family)